MILSELRTEVRAQLDLPEEDDLPRALIDAYLAEGFEQVTNMEGQWPFYEVEWTLEAAANAEFVALPADLDAIEAVFTDKHMLSSVPYRDARERFGGDDGAAEMYSLRGGRLFLWPRPREATSLTIAGWRLPDYGWITQEANTPDTGNDRRFDRCLVHYACYRVYAQQEDEVLAEFYFQTFQRLLMSAREAVMRDDVQEIATMGSGLPRARRAVRLGTTFS